MTFFGKNIEKSDCVRTQMLRNIFLGFVERDKVRNFAIS